MEPQRTWPACSSTARKFNRFRPRASPSNPRRHRNGEGELPEEGMASLIRNLEAKTGKSIDAWIATARATGHTKHGQIVAALKKDHGLTHGYANQIAQRALASLTPPPTSDSDPIDALYSGAKAGLRPIHDKLTAAMKKFGSDVEFAPKKGYVSVRRSKQFALIQPSTSTRVDRRPDPQEHTRVGSSRGVGQLQRDVHASRPVGHRGRRQRGADRLAPPGVRHGVRGCAPH